MNVLSVIIQSFGEPHRRGYRISEETSRTAAVAAAAASSRRMQQRYDEKSIFKILSRDAAWKGSSEMNGGVVVVAGDWLFFGPIFPQQILCK